MFSLITLYLSPVIGFPWTMRIIGFISLACCTVACLTLQTRPAIMSHRPTPNKSDTKPSLPTILLYAIDLRLLAHDPSYLTTTVAITIIEFAVFLPITYLSSAALASGLPAQTSYRLIALLNVGSVPGRALPNYLSDHLGRFNVMITTAVACTLLIFCLWLPPTALDVTSEAALTVFAVLFGFWSGAAISLTPVCVAQVSEVGEVGRRVGTTFSIASFGALVGVPIGGAIVDATPGGGYLWLVVFSGGCYVLAAGAFGVARWVAGPKRVWAAF